MLQNRMMLSQKYLLHILTEVPLPAVGKFKNLPQNLEADIDAAFVKVKAFMAAIVGFACSAIPPGIWN